MVASKWAERFSLMGVLAVAAAFVALFAFSETVQSLALGVLDWFDRQGSWGAVLYVCMYVAIVLLLVPAIIFTLGAGFVFGFVQGLLVVMVSMAISAPAAFLLARHTFGENIACKLREHPRLKVLSNALRDDGWKIVLLSRLVPGFPFKLSNYFFGLTEISLRHFFIGSMLGLLPLTVVNVYVGSLVSRLPDLLKREPEPWEWGLYGIGAVAAVALVFYIVRIARRAMQRALDRE